MRTRGQGAVQGPVSHAALSADWLPRLGEPTHLSLGTYCLARTTTTVLRPRPTLQVPGSPSLRVSIGWTGAHATASSTECLASACRLPGHGVGAERGQLPQTIL